MGRSKEKNLAKEGGEENFAGGQRNGRTGPLKVAKKVLADLKTKKKTFWIHFPAIPRDRG